MLAKDNTTSPQSPPSSDSVVVLVRLTVLNHALVEPRKFAVVCSVDDLISQLYENIGQIYGTVFIEDPQIRVVQIKYKDYIVPPHYAICDIVKPYSEILALAYEIAPRIPHTYIPYSVGTQVHSKAIMSQLPPTKQDIRNVVEKPNGKRRAFEPVVRKSSKIVEIPVTPEAKKKKKVEPQKNNKKPLKKEAESENNTPESTPDKKQGIIKLKKVENSEDDEFIDEGSNGKEEKTMSPTRVDKEKDEIIKELIQAQENQDSDSDSLIAEYDAQVEGITKEKTKSKAKYQGPKEYKNLFKKLKQQK